MDASPGEKLKRYKDNPHQLERGIRKACKKKRADLELKIENSRIKAEEAEQDWFIGFDDLQKLRDIEEECNKYRNVLDTPLGDKGDETKGRGAGEPGGEDVDVVGEENGGEGHGEKGDVKLIIFFYSINYRKICPLDTLLFVCATMILLMLVIRLKKINVF